jgi:hypothetical protein
MIVDMKLTRTKLNKNSEQKSQKLIRNRKYNLPNHYSRRESEAKELVNA